jgi:allantoicase
MDSEQPSDGWETVAKFERRHESNADWVLVAGGVPDVDATISGIRAWLDDRVKRGLVAEDAIRIETVYCDGPSPDSSDILRVQLKAEAR